MSVMVTLGHAGKPKLEVLYSNFEVEHKPNCLAAPKYPKVKSDFPGSIWSSMTLNRTSSRGWRTAVPASYYVVDIIDARSTE